MKPPGIMYTVGAIKSNVYTDQEDTRVEVSCYNHSTLLRINVPLLRLEGRDRENSRNNDSHLKIKTLDLQ